MRVDRSIVSERVNPATLGPVEALSLTRQGLAAASLWRIAFALTLLLGCSSKDEGSKNTVTPRGGSGAGAMAGMGPVAGTAGAMNVGGASGMAGSAGASGTAGASTCGVGQLSCNGVCATTATDPANCGTCGTGCSAGSQCIAGACQVTCGTGQLLCAGSCRTIVSDPANCGACGTICPAGQVCSAGTCTASCGTLQACGAQATECADVMTNPSHCGACGAACAPGQSCVAGACVLNNCPAGLTACNGRCVDTKTNALNCGACGTACAAGTPCINGFCGCPTGQTLCNGTCVDTTNSGANCGACGMACPVGQACEASTCRAGCSAGLTRCNGSCVNVQEDELNCGVCGTACASAQTCTAGSCACPGGGMLCASACVDTQTDEMNCGVCGTACGTGQTCVGGMCTCPDMLTACGNTCVNTQTSNDHCGSCNQPCDAGATCMAGMCTCPMGQMACGGLCVDVQTSPANCGMCGMACATGQTCVAGNCSGAGGVGADGCTGGLALNIAVSRIDVFQTVAVGIMDDGEAIEPSERNTDLVEMKETVFRVFVTPGSSWTTRELSARVTIVNGAASQEYFSKKMVSGASSEGNTQSTFQITVPAEEILETTQYRVELVECGTPPSGMVTTPLFPLDGEANLGARVTGPLKITMVPFLCNSLTPDTTEEGLQIYHDILQAMYPVSGVEFTVGQQLSTGYPVDWNDALDAVRSRRQQDGPSADVYYYGLLKCEDTFREFCGNGCTAGIGYVSNQAQARASMGIAFTDNQSAGTMAHEIGHNHGRNHAPCVPQGGSISGVDQQFPYDGGNIGVWGYDSRTKELVDPDGITDIMGYCNNKWISDYTYDGLVTRVASVNGANEILLNRDLLDTWRVILLDKAGPRWGRPVTTLAPPVGMAEVAEMLDADGDLIEHTIVYRNEVPDIDAASIMVPSPKRGWAAVRLSGVPALPFK